MGETHRVRAEGPSGRASVPSPGGIKVCYLPCISAFISQEAPSTLCPEVLLEFHYRSMMIKSPVVWLNSVSSPPPLPKC